MSTVRTTVKRFDAESSAAFTTETGKSIALARCYFNRTDDRSQIKSSFKQLWGQGIRKEKDPARVGGDDTTDDGSASTGMIEVYDKVGFGVQVDAGFKETLSVGFGTKIINAHSTLFTEDTGKMALVHPNTTKENKVDVGAAEALLFDQRERGGFDTAIVRTDRLSIALGSIALFQNYANGAPTYDYYDKSQVRAFFGDTVDKDGKKEAPNQKRIEDATYIIIRLGQADSAQWNYLAIFGRSKKYKLGRWVTYTTGDTVDVPEKGSKIATEFVLDMEGVEPVECNPWTWYALQNPELDLPEYPLTVFYGGFTEGNEIMPTSSALHDTSIEFDRSASHTLSCANECATNTLAIERTSAAEGRPLPKTKSGSISLSPGQKAMPIPADSASVQVAYTVMRSEMIDAGAGWDVPDYMVVSEDHTLDASSGIAIQTKSRSLIKRRDFRIKENMRSVLGVFEREKILIDMFAKGADDAAVALLKECSLQWDAGRIVFPENKKEEAERIALLKKNGILDEIGGIREYRKFATDEEAIEEYKKMKARAKKYPPLNQEDEQKKEFSLLRNRGSKGVTS